MNKNRIQKPEIITKPEAIARIMDGLEKKGLYQPEDLTYIPEIDGEKPEGKKGLTLTLDQYGKLKQRSIDAGLSGDWKRAEYIRGIMDRHAPEYILNLKAIHTI